MISDEELIKKSKEISRFLRSKAKNIVSKRNELIKKPNIFYVDGHNGKHPVIIFSSFPCPKYLQGFCTPCLYSNINHSNLDKDLVYDSLIDQTSFVINNFDDLITNKQKEVGYKNLNIRYPNNKLVTFELCGEGSFLSTPEIPKKHRDKIINLFYDYSKENKLNMQMILEAKATDFLKEDFEGKKELINDLNMTLLFGFESADYFVREVIYNKWLKLNYFESAINKGKELGFRTAGFVFCGCHSMTQKEIINDVKKSIDYLKERDTAIYLMIPNLQPFTLNHLLYSYGKYGFIEPRTILEMVKYLVNDSNSSKSSYYFNGFNWSIGGLTTYPEPELFLFSNGNNITCKECSTKIKEAVYDLMNSYNVEKFENKMEDLNSCECKKNTKNLL